MVTLNLASALLLILHDCMSGLLQISLNHQQRSTMVFFSVLTHRKQFQLFKKAEQRRRNAIFADEISVEVVENKMGKSKIINRERKNTPIWRTALIFSFRLFFFNSFNCAIMEVSSELKNERDLEEKKEENEFSFRIFTFFSTAKHQASTSHTFRQAFQHMKHV